MRIFSILTALLVTATLYLLVFERPALMAFALGEEGATPQEVVVEDAVAPDTRVSVVALNSTATVIDSAVLLRGRTEAAREVMVSAETNGRIISQPLRKGGFVTEGQMLCQLDPGTRAAQLAEAEARLGTNGRLLVRASGTEPVIRVMAEGEMKLIRSVVDDVRAAIERVAA